VARLAFGSVTGLRGATFDVPLDLEEPVAVSMLAATVTLTPGTVTLLIDLPGRRLVVHALDEPDPDAVVIQIKQRYENRLKEIFGC
jgi:multicomponent K+:H+ antiporter subunit E